MVRINNVNIDAETVRISIVVIIIARIFFVVWEGTNGSFFLFLFVVVVCFGQYGYFRESNQ